MKSRWADYGDKSILYMDFSNFHDNVRAFEKEMTSAIAELGPRMYEQPLRSVLVLVDVTNTTMSQTATSKLSDAIGDTKKHVRRTAVIGMTGFRKIFLDYFSMLASSETGSFENTEDALKWLLRTI